MSTMPLDHLSFFNAVQRGVRASAGKALARALRRWRNTRSGAEWEAAPLPPAERFLIRYGLLDAGQEPVQRQRAYGALLRSVARASGEAPGVTAAWLEAFASAEYGWAQPAVCGDEPHCLTCPLCESCLFLAAGAQENRLSGEGLARDLTTDVAPARDTSGAAELLAFVLSGDRSGKAAVARAQALLHHLGGLRGLLSATPAALHGQALDRDTVARVRALAGLFELWRSEPGAHGRAFTCAQDFYDHYHLRLRDLKKECFLVACLDQKNRLLAEEQVSTGSLTEALVHPREVFAPAVALHAAAVAVVHNHPSGDPAPSPEDRALTKRLQHAGELVGIRLLDHVIVGDTSYTSFAEKGWV